MVEEWVYGWVRRRGGEREGAGGKEYRLRFGVPVLCCASSTSFEFLISKPPCNYWINVNYEDALCRLGEWGEWVEVERVRSETKVQRERDRTTKPRSATLRQRGLRIIKIRWLICKFNKITVPGTNEHFVYPLSFTHSLTSSSIPLCSFGTRVQLVDDFPVF